MAPKNKRRISLSLCEFYQPFVQEAQKRKMQMTDLIEEILQEHFIMSIDRKGEPNEELCQH